MTQLEGFDIQGAWGHYYISLNHPAIAAVGEAKSHFFLNSSFANMPRQRKAKKRSTLDMSPPDAADRGLSSGQQVVVKNDQGALTAWLRVTDRIRPGVVCLPGKWWSLPAETGAVANVLTPASWSPGGQPAYNEAFVEMVGTA